MICLLSAEVWVVWRDRTRAMVLAWTNIDWGILRGELTSHWHIQGAQLNNFNFIFECRRIQIYPLSQMFHNCDFIWDPENFVCTRITTLTLG